MGKKIFRWALLTMALIHFWIPFVQAETPSIEVQVDHDTLNIEDTLTLQITIRGGAAMTQPEIPNRGNFEVLRQSGGSTVEIQEDGQMAVTKMMEYVLKPTQSGQFVLGPVTVHIEGRAYSSPPIKVTVLNDKKSLTYQAIPPDRQVPPVGEDKFGVPQENLPPTASSRSETFLTAETDKKEAYVGEQVIYTFRLYSSVSVANAQLELPNFKDFISEELIKERRYEVDLQGKHYAVNEWRIALFATRAGDLKIAETKVRGDVPIFVPRAFSNDPFFMGLSRPTRLEQKSFRSPSLTLKIRELPPAPEDFTGLVGQFEIETRVSPENLSLGDTLNVEIEIQGKGNLNEAKLPDMTQNDFFKIYPGKPRLNLEKSLTGLSGSKIFPQAWVAERPGQTEVPVFHLSYFEPQSGRYLPLAPVPQKISVLGNETSEKLVTADSSPGATDPSQKDQALGLTEIQAPQFLLKNDALSLYEKVLWGLGLATAPLALLWALWKKRRRSPEKNAEDKKRSRAFKEARNALNQPLTVQGQLDYNHLSQVLRDYLSQHFSIKGAALTPSEVEKLLETKAVPAQTVRRTIYWLEQFDLWKYGGMGDAFPPEKEIKAEILDLLREVEKAL